MMQKATRSACFAIVATVACFSTGAAYAGARDWDLKGKCNWYQQQAFKAGRQAKEAPAGSQAQRRLEQKSQCWRQTYYRCIKGAIFPDDRPC
jgi:hypothetical protein